VAPVVDGFWQDESVHPACGATVIVEAMAGLVDGKSNATEATVVPGDAQEVLEPPQAPIVNVLVATTPDMCIQTIAIHCDVETLIGEARLTVFNERLESPVRLSTSATVNVWPLLVKRHCEVTLQMPTPYWVVAGLVPAGYVRTTILSGMVVPVKTLACVSVPVNGAWNIVPHPSVVALVKMQNVPVHDPESAWFAAYPAYCEVAWAGPGRMSSERSARKKRGRSLRMGECSVSTCRVDISC